MTECKICICDDDDDEQDESRARQDEFTNYQRTRTKKEEHDMSPTYVAQMFHAIASLGDFI